PDHIAGAIDGIDTDVHHRASSGQGLIQPPLRGVPYRETGETLEEQDLAELPGLSHADDLERMRFEMHPVADQQPDASLFAGVYHFLTFFGIHGHRLFANSVFAGLRHPYDGVMMKRVGRYDGHRIDIGVVTDCIVTRIVVTILFRDMVFGLPCPDLGRRAADDAHQRGPCTTL